jgi:hypothetical protein
VIVLDALHFVFLAFLGQGVDDVRLGRVHPPAVNALGKQAFARVLPEQVVRRRIIDIIIPETGPTDRRVQVTVLFHVLVNRRGRPESLPDGNDEVKILLVKDINHFLWVGVQLLVKKHAAPVGVAAPVIPVLDEAINGDLQRAVFLSDAQQLIAGRVMLLALPVAVSPFAIHRRLSRQIPVSGNGVVHVFAADEIVVQVVTHLGPERHVVRVVGKNGFGIIVPENPPARGGNQKRRDRLGVGLHQLDGASAIIHVPGLMLPQAINAFIRRQLEILLNAERILFVLDLDRLNVCPALFRKDRTVVGGEILDGAVVFGQLQPDFPGSEGDGSGILLKLDVQIRRVGLNHDQARLLGCAAGRPLDDADPVVRIELHLDVQPVGFQFDAVLNAFDLYNFRRGRFRLAGSQHKAQTEDAEQSHCPPGGR